MKRKRALDSTHFHDPRFTRDMTQCGRFALALKSTDDVGKVDCRGCLANLGLSSVPSAVTTR